MSKLQPAAVGVAASRRHQKVASLDEPAGGQVRSGQFSGPALADVPQDKATASGGNRAPIDDRRACDTAPDLARVNVDVAVDGYSVSVQVLSASSRATARTPDEEAPDRIDIGLEPAREMESLAAIKSL